MLLTHVWVIFAIPIASFLFILLLGKKVLGGNEKAVSAVGIGAVAATFVLSLIAGSQWLDRPQVVLGGAHGAEAGAVHGEADAGHGAEGAAHGEEGAGGSHALPSSAVLPEQGLCRDVEVAGGTSASADHGASEVAAGATPLVRASEAHEEKVYTPVQCTTEWFSFGPVTFETGTYVDGMTIVLLLVVTLVSLMVHVFAASYMHGDVRFTHFYAALSLFTAGMLVMITASSTLQLLFGWELMGVCSFMLIGHWWEDEANSRAALKAFFTTRTGDIGLLVGISMLFWMVGEATGTPSFNIDATNTLAFEGALGSTALVVACGFLLLAVIGKSAQLPLHTWLPDAMAGPTPVSALIHAATMVVAGVYLVARLYPTFWQAFDIGEGGATPIAIVGGATIIIAALLAFVQRDLKKVLAYSTVSQLGYMVMALGVGAWTAALFHLFTHAFFKACLFLGAGSVSHACHHSFDMKDEMGGLWRKMPVTFATFSVSTLALMGVFPFAGFWSKDEILVGAGEYGYQIFMIVGLVGAFLTAAYMSRCMYLTFFGTYRGHSHPHESPKLLTTPLIVLGVLAVVAGFANAFFFEHPFDKITATALNLEAYTQAGLPSVLEFDVVAAGISTGVVAAAIAIMYLWYVKGVGVQGITERNAVARGGLRLLENRYYLDHLWGGVRGAGGVVGGIAGPVARAAYWTNNKILDGVVNGAGIVTKALAGFSDKTIDRRVVDGVVNGSGVSARTSGGVLRRLQSGQVQTYAAWLFGAAGVLAAIMVITS